MGSFCRDAPDDVFDDIIELPSLYVNVLAFPITSGRTVSLMRKTSSLFCLFSPLVCLQYDIFDEEVSTEQPESLRYDPVFFWCHGDRTSGFSTQKISHYTICNQITRSPKHFRMVIEESLYALVNDFSYLVRKLLRPFNYDTCASLEKDKIKLSFLTFSWHPARIAMSV